MHFLGHISPRQKTRKPGQGDQSQKTIKKRLVIGGDNQGRAYFFEIF